MKRYCLFGFCVIHCFSLFGTQYIKQGNAWGKFGSGFGEGFCKGFQDRSQQTSQACSNNGYYEHTKFSFDPICSFNYKENIITLRLNKTSGFYPSKEQTRNFYYILKINDDVKKDCSVYLSLNDANGFQIGDKIFIENISKEFKGFLKGNFDFRMLESEQICGAELNYYNY